MHLNYIIWVLNLADVSEHHPPDVVNGVSQGIILFQRLSKAEHMKCHIGPSCVWVFVGTAMQKPWLFRICCLFSQSLNVWEKIPHCKRLSLKSVISFQHHLTQTEGFLYVHFSFLQCAPVHFKSWLLWASVYTFPVVINSLCLTSFSYLNSLDIQLLILNLFFFSLNIHRDPDNDYFWIIQLKYITKNSMTSRHVCIFFSIVSWISKGRAGQPRMVELAVRD